MAHQQSLAQPVDVREMFDRIAPEYDRFNALASFGLHQSWRQALVRQIPTGARVLDIATGTGDVAFLARAHGHDVVGVDFSERMIERAVAKDTKRSILWLKGSADNLVFGDESFGCVTSAFALRNFRGSIDQVFKENFRVLKQGGQVLHLDFGRPQRRLMRLGHQLHMLWGVPTIGRLLCGQRWPAQYLEHTIDKFFEPSEVEDLLEAAGFINVGHESLLGGVVRIYRGTKAC